MDLEEGLNAENWTKTLMSGNMLQNASLSNQSFPMSILQQPQQHDQNREHHPIPSNLDFNSQIDCLFSKLNQVSGNNNPSHLSCSFGDHSKSTSTSDDRQSKRNPGWDPSAMLNNLSFLEQKVHQLQELVHLIVRRRVQVSGCITDELLTQQQQLITADITSIIVQLISTAGTLLPSVKNGLLSANLLTEQFAQFNGFNIPSATGPYTGLLPSIIGGPVLDNAGEAKQQLDQPSSSLDRNGNWEMDHNPNNSMDDHESKDEDDPIEEEHLPPGSFEILQLEKEEILAPHTHFCTICGKGFKRDANLRMHMRGHGDEYKTPAALAKPHKKSSNGSEPNLIRRYSCPFAGCKRNKDHKKFQPLKTILCVKNHYKRTHCDKTYTCSRCHAKKFSVIADLKTHEKHCGKDKWLCSCGTTFSRKDKLFGHITLFQGHTPAIPLDENLGKGSTGTSSDLVDNGEALTNMTNKVGSGSSTGFSFVADSPFSIQSMMDAKGSSSTMDDISTILGGFDPCNLGGFQEFSQSGFDDSGSPFSFLIPGNKNVLQPDTTDDMNP